MQAEPAARRCEGEKDEGGKLGGNGEVFIKTVRRRGRRDTEWGNEATDHYRKPQSAPVSPRRTLFIKEYQLLIVSQHRAILLLSRYFCTAVQNCPVRFILSDLDLYYFFRER